MGHPQALVPGGNVFGGVGITLRGGGIGSWFTKLVGGALNTGGRFEACDTNTGGGAFPVIPAAVMRAVMMPASNFGSALTMSRSAADNPDALAPVFPPWPPVSPSPALVSS